jgi:hypothetical protein
VADSAQPSGGVGGAAERCGQHRGHPSTTPHEYPSEHQLLLTARRIAPSLTDIDDGAIDYQFRHSALAAIVHGR